MRKGFYTFLPTRHNKWFYGQIAEKDIKTIDKWMGNGMRGFKGIVHIDITRGTTASDILWTGFPLRIVSLKVIEIWTQYEKLETYPIVIEGSVSPLEYNGVAFLGRGGPFDPVRSKAVYSKKPSDGSDPVIVRQEGMYFDDNQWDGSDLFTIDEFPCVHIVTEKVIKAMKKAKVTNCVYIPLERYGIFGTKKTLR